MVTRRDRRRPGGQAAAGWAFTDNASLNVTGRLSGISDEPMKYALLHAFTRPEPLNGRQLAASLRTDGVFYS